MKHEFFQVDSFASRVFTGNPAGVCPLESWLPDEILLSIAYENNLSETAFFVPKGSGYEIRWFTPVAEVNLCGHATLAAGYVLYNFLGFSGEKIEFQSLSGLLTVARSGERLTLDFPVWAGVPMAVPLPLVEGLGAAPREVLKARELLAVFDSADDVARLTPNGALLEGLEGLGVIATAPGTDCDFVSRCFFPKLGIPEDPVTGSAHCTSVPYWAARLGKTELFARQISARGGELWCSLRGERVLISGDCRLYLRGELFLK